MTTFANRVVRFRAAILLMAPAAALLFGSGPMAKAGDTNAPPGPQVPTQVMGVYRPLEQGARAQVVNALKPLVDKYGTNRAPVLINLAAGNNRLILGREMLAMLKEAGIPAEMGDTELITQMPAAATADICVKCNQGETPFATDLSGAFAGLVPQKIPKIQMPDWAAGRVEIYIFGDPVFSPKGVVTF